MNYIQSTYETCLASCLLILDNKHVEKNLELEILKHSLDYSKFDFVSGHLDFFKDKVSFERIVDNKIFLKHLESVNVEYKNVKVKKVNTKLIDFLLQNYGKVIVYLDSYILYQDVHYPHFILINGRSDKYYEVIDPWNGEKKLISKNVIKEGINMLNNHLLFCPQLIYKNKF